MFAIGFQFLDVSHVDSDSILSYFFIYLLLLTKFLNFAKLLLEFQALLFVLITLTSLDLKISISSILPSQIL